MLNPTHRYSTPQQHYLHHFLFNTTMPSSALVQMQPNNCTLNSVTHLTKTSAPTSLQASYRILASLAPTSPSTDTCAAHALTAQQVNIAAHQTLHQHLLPHNPSAPSSPSTPNSYPCHPQAITLMKSSSLMNSLATSPSSEPHPKPPKLSSSLFSS